MLVNGWSGPKARLFQVRYITAFNLMRQALEVRNQELMRGLDPAVIGGIVKRIARRERAELLAELREEILPILDSGDDHQCRGSATSRSAIWCSRVKSRSSKTAITSGTISSRPELR
jgi:hypothetical protein